MNACRTDGRTDAYEKKEEEQEEERRRTRTRTRTRRRRRRRRRRRMGRASHHQSVSQSAVQLPVVGTTCRSVGPSVVWLEEPYMLVRTHHHRWNRRTHARTHTRRQAGRQAAKTSTHARTRGRMHAWLRRKERVDVLLKINVQCLLLAGQTCTQTHILRTSPPTGLMMSSSWNEK